MDDLVLEVSLHFIPLSSMTKDDYALIELPHSLSSSGKMQELGSLAVRMARMTAYFLDEKGSS